MISIITPTHNPKYLEEAYESLKAQTFQDWEWIIIPNNGAKVDSKNEKIKIVPYEKKTENIGDIKKFAFAQGKGEIILELDHDDLLTPQALEKVAEIFKDPEVVFCDSNFAEFFYDHETKKNWEPNFYNLDYGWKYREKEFYGHKFQEVLGYDITAASLALIYWAPNHLRAWRRKSYEEIGGHNPDLKVADDHDLCCRTYLYGKCVHIPECLYLYRIHTKNAWIKFNPIIQKLTQEVKDKYLYTLVEKWCQKNNLRKIDLGGALGSPNGYESVDLEDADIRCDLNDKWPFEDNSIGLIRAWDILEHLKDPIHTMNEIYRVLTPGGWLLSLTPSTDGRGAFQDPTHVSFWNENSFWYYTKSGFAKYLHGKFKGRFQSVRLRTEFPLEWQRENNIPYVRADLIAIKEGVQIPGLIEI